MQHTMKGFSLIELLVVISIIGVLIGLSVFGLQGARESSRDARRKADLEQIRSGIEIYKSDCGSYPASLTFGGELVGTGTPGTCAVANTYISQVPDDPSFPAKGYLYSSSSGTKYELCASLEQPSGSGSENCGGSTSCGSDTCNYKVTNP